MAKKSKGFAELLKQQQMGDEEYAGIERLRKKVQNSSIANQIGELVVSDSNTEKMSEVLKEFVDPYLDFADNKTQQQRIFETAVIAWNVSIMPDKKQKKAIDEMVKELITDDVQAKEDFKEILNEMIERKQKLFPNNKRLIVNFEVQGIGKKLSLSVASTLTGRPEK